MVKKTCLFLFCTLIFACSSHKNKTNKYEITDSVTFKFNETDSLRVNELRFTPNFSSADLQKYLYKKYGKWNNQIKSKRKDDFLVWENIKLLNTSNELYTIAASGEDIKFETIKINGVQKYGHIIYCSAIVFNSKNQDCFNSSSHLIDSLAKSFIDGTKSLSKEDSFVEKNIFNISN